MTKVELAIDQWRREMPGLDLLPMEVIGRLGKATRLISRGHLDPFFQRQGLHQGSSTCWRRCVGPVPPTRWHRLNCSRPC
ncbi:hypothetical protein [Marinobacterium aestuariivivens]|uniref:Uncharacterized protein n=1 Tax=Marinobacterium aestuariivivens TaxID=1698799 RepID=A0ABW1ZXT9_9GAMM